MSDFINGDKSTGGQRHADREAAPQPRRRGKSRTTLEKLSDAVDAALIAMLAPKPLLDNKGRAVLDANGQPVMRQPTPAEVTIAARRVRDVGLADRRRAELEADERSRTDRTHPLGRAKVIPFRRGNGGAA